MTLKRTMTGSRTAAEAYARTVTNDLQSYTRDLLRANESLKAALDAAREEKQRLESQLRIVKGLLGENAALRELASDLERENAQLSDQIVALRQELEYSEREKLRLQSPREDARGDERRFPEAYVELEKRTERLISLYAQTCRLHGTLNRGEVLGVLQEILVDVFGSEGMAIFEMDNAGSALLLVATHGVEPDALWKIPLGAGPIGRTAASGEGFVGATAPAEHAASGEIVPSACIPLKLESRVIGAIALFGTPRQGALDPQLLEILAVHAAAALHCTSPQARTAFVGATT